MKEFIKQYTFLSLSAFLVAAHFLMFLGSVEGNIIGATLNLFVPFGFWNIHASANLLNIPPIAFCLEIFLVELWFRAKQFSFQKKIIISLVLLLVTTCLVDVLLWKKFQSLAVFLEYFYIDIPQIME